MAKKSVPLNKAALYFNELAPIDGSGERCAFFGHFYHPPAPDALLTRAVVALPAGTWGVVNDIDVNDIIAGAVYWESDSVRQICAVYRSGESFVFRGTARVAVPIPPGVGFLSGVRRIGAGIYACGSQNAVYRFDETRWTDIAGSLRSSSNDLILTSIDGFDEKNIYAVGYDGSIVHFDGTRWRSLESPTNQHLHQVVCHEDGRIYLCGRGGVVFGGTPDAWKDLALPGHTEDFWGLAAFAGDVYACTYRRLFRITEGGLDEQIVAQSSAGTFYRLAANDSFMWVTTGTGHVLRFDNKSWAQFTWPDNT